MFVSWPTHPFVRRLERVGYALRKRVGLSDLEALDPAKLIATYSNMVLFDIGPDLNKSPAALKLLTEHSSKWSALAYRENGGPWLITWNPFHAHVRIRASLLEEVAHIILEHKPTQLIPDPVTGLPRRTYTPSKEKEAYGVAAASLLPFNGLTRSLKLGCSETEIAQRFQVSEQLVQYRINVTRAAA